MSEAINERKKNLTINNDTKNGSKQKTVSFGKKSVTASSFTLREIYSGNAKNCLDEIQKQKIIQSARGHDTCLWWYCLVLLRFFLAVTQTGYIHPDEFHQSLQVRAKDVLSIEGQKPWEFTSSSPLRSIVFSGVVSLPYTFINWLESYTYELFQWKLVTPNTLLVCPRVFMTALSLTADFCVYRIARMCYMRPWECMEVFASSYVMLVYSTRTFSNTMELILMCLVLWRVALSIVESTKTFRKENILTDMYQVADTMREKVRLARIKSGLPAYNYADSFLLSVVVTYGTFVRPTFIIYTFVPLMFWLQRGVVTKNLDFKYFNRRFLSLVPGVVATTVICVVADSLYYQSVTIKELLHFNVTSLSFTVTPFNFFLYNKNPQNLAKHGTHPRYLHFLVNLFLLHGVLALVGAYNASMFFSSLFSTSKITRKPKVYSLGTMLLLSYVVPVFVLSIAPHQEPRFLLPTLPCLILLHCDKIKLDNFFNLKFKTHYLFIFWQLWNILCVTFYGYLHQSGVTTAVQHAQSYIERSAETNSSLDAPVHVYFSNMYSPPTFLLLRRIDVVTTSSRGTKYKRARNVFSHHLTGGKDPAYINQLLFSRLTDTVDQTTDKTSSLFHFSKGMPKSTEPPDVLLCTPTHIGDSLKANNAAHHLNFTILHHIPWHVGLDDIQITSRGLQNILGMDIFKVELPYWDKRC